MDDTEKLKMQIQILRKELSDLIEKKDNLLDEEVIALSQKIDILLNEYKKAEN